MNVLFCMPVGKDGEENLKKIINKLHQAKFVFDLCLFAYDDVDLTNISKKDVVFREKLQKWGFALKYLTPSYVSGYDYIMLWDDDLFISDDFSFDCYFDIVKKNQLDLSQPALTKESYYSHEITLKETDGIGRVTNFVEIMCPCYTNEAWNLIYPLLDENNVMGHGYDYIEYGKKGIIDCCTVTHTRPVSSGKTTAIKDGERWIAKNNIKLKTKDNLGLLE